MNEKIADEIKSRCEAALRPRSPGWPEFRMRLDAEFGNLAGLMWELYGARPDFAYRLEDMVAEANAYFEARPERLRETDRERTPESGWISSNAQVGAVAYVDRFAGTFDGIEGRIPYLKELGVTYLHLMPFFRMPEGENDGGYAVSSYRETSPALGTMEDLERLAVSLGENGIALVADFVFNHTSNEHEWAHRAITGEREFEDFYLAFDSESEAAKYQAHLRDIFPEARKGSFTFVQEIGKWVWTTFHSYQWDLNYRNPRVLRAMASEMMSLANRGVSVLRLDAVAFVWKEAGTSCENLNEAHTIIRIFQAMARLACPSLAFKSEAIVHPDDIERYVDLRECQLSYNPLLMAELWEASATREVRLLAHSLSKRHALPKGCAWVNYVRCHDDIGWTFADEDAAELGISGFDHRAFLNRFYLGEFPGSFSRGVSFQHDPKTGDRRICGTAASLAGVELAVEQDSDTALDIAVARLRLMYGIVFSAGGIPLVYLGDEVASLNDYSYGKDPDRAGDSRWVHRPAWSDGLSARRLVRGTVEERVFSGIAGMSRARKQNQVFGEPSLEVMDSGHPSVLAFRKRRGHDTLVVLANFSESNVALDSGRADSLIGKTEAADLLGGGRRNPGTRLELGPCALKWFLADSP